jgi:enamine deaminase RidA (YjgF/YER057c/UK114 family)
MNNPTIYLGCLLALSLSDAATAGEPPAHTINPLGLPPASGYSHVVIAPTGRLVSISGQVAIDADGAVVGVGDFEAQCIQVFENLKVALHSAGLTFADVIRTDMYVTDMKHLDTLRAVRARYLPNDAPPASTLVKVASLYRPELLVEVAVDAILQESPAPPATTKDSDAGH